MRTASKIFQPIALAALLAAQVHGAITMPGVRRTLRLIAGQPAPIFCSSAVRIAAAGPSGANGALQPCP
jgi:hypothetical protein